MFGLDVGALIGFTIDSEIIPKLIASINNICIVLIHLNLHAIATHNSSPIIVPILMPGYAFTTGVWGFPDSIVLQSTIDVVRGLLVGVNCVELTHSGLVIFNPVLTTIIADIDSAIIAIDQMFGVVGVYPQCMMVDVRIGCIYAFKCLPSIK